MIKSDSVTKLFTALAAAQVEFLPILKTKENPGFKRDGKPSKYADLETAIEATQPALNKNGLVVVQFPVNEADRIGVFSILGHTSGEYFGESFTLPLATNTAQVGVAAVTYARRAGYLAVIGAAAEDDDGNTAAGKIVNEAEISTPKAKSAAAPATNSTIAASAPKTESASSTTISVGASGLQLDGKPYLENVQLADGPLPTDEEMLEIRKQFSTLSEKLAAAGLKASRNRPAPIKLKEFLLKRVGQTDVSKVTKLQWDTFFLFSTEMLNTELVNLIDPKEGK